MHEADTFQAVLRTDLAALAEKCLAHSAPSAAFKIAWHHQAITHQLDRAARRQFRRLIINQPPRTAKTHLVGVSFVVHLLIQDPTLKIAILSYDQPLASRSVRAVRDILQSAWFQALAPGTRIRPDKNTETHVQTTAGGEVRAFSLEGGITGHGFDFIIMDDPMKADDAHSEPARRALEEKYRIEIANRWLNPSEGILILVMQRLHADDFTAFFRKVHPDAEHLVIPAIAPENLVYEIGGGRTHVFEKGTSIEPHRLPLTELDSMRRVQGSANFEAQYQQAPLASGGRVVDPDWFLPLGKPRSRDFRIISIDPAFTEDGGDFSAALVCDLIGEEVELTAGHQVQLEYPRLIRWIRDLDKKYRPDLLVVEAIGAGRGIKSYLSEFGIRHVATVDNHKGLSKLERMEVVSPKIEAGAVRLPIEEEWARDFLRVIGDFPAGTSDDWPDALSQLLLYIKEVRLHAARHRQDRFPPELPRRSMPMTELPCYQRWLI